MPFDASNLCAQGIAHWDISQTSLSGTLQDNEFNADSPVDSALWAVASPGTGSFSIQFDLFSDPAAPLGHFSIPDFFQASLYFTDDLAAFNVFDSATFSVIDLVLADMGGVQNLTSTGALISGSDGFSFSYSFESEHAYVIPYFVLFDLDFQPGNSNVRIDGLAISAPVQSVSEPGAFLIIWVGAIAGLAFQRRTRA